VTACFFPRRMCGRYKIELNRRYLSIHHLCARCANSRIFISRTKVSNYRPATCIFNDLERFWQVSILIKRELELRDKNVAHGGDQRSLNVGVRSFARAASITSLACDRYSLARPILPTRISMSAAWARCWGKNWISMRSRSASTPLGEGLRHHASLSFAVAAQSCGTLRLRMAAAYGRVSHALHARSNCVSASASRPRF
jgi:hypothetical protein